MTKFQFCRHIHGGKKSHFINVSVFFLKVYQKIHFDSGLAACTHFCDHILLLLLLLQKFIFVVLRSDSNPKRSLLKNKTRAHGIPPARQSTPVCLLSCVCVHVGFWLGFFRRSKKTKPIRRSNPNPQSSVQVVFQSDLRLGGGGIKERGCRESNQTKHEWA